MSGQEILQKILEVLISVLRIIYWYLEALYHQFIPPPMQSIEGETILVTGAAGGIGKEICRHLVRSASNLKLVIWDLNMADLEKLAAELKASNGGAKVYPFAVDISARENINAACKQLKDTVGPATIIFNNAGVAHQGNFLQLTDDQIEQTMQINLMSHFWVIRQFLPDMVTKNHGRIVNTCSMGGLRAAPHALPYFASKFAVNGYTESLKCELELFKYTGIHLTTVYPYFVQTPLIKTLKLSKQPKGLPASFQRFLSPAEVAKLAVDGMRREYEYVYAPKIIPIITFTDYLFPLKLRKAAEASHIENFSHTNTADQRRMDMTYLETIRERKLTK